MTLRTVKLYGALGEKFGREFRLDVNTPRDAVRLLSANFRDFPAEVLNHEAGYHIIVGDNSVGEHDLSKSAMGDQTIKIIPVVQGAGDDGFFQVVLGAALIWASGGFAGLGAGFGGLGVGFGKAATLGWSIVGNVGVSLVLGGVSQMLFGAPEAPKSVERPENKPSYLFDGPVNTTRQGGAVPVGYGEMLVGGQVISAGLFAEDIGV